MSPKIIQRSIFVLIALMSLNTIRCGKRPFTIVFHNVSCPTFDPICQLAECDLKKLGTSRYSLSGMFKLSRTMPEHIVGRAMIHVRGIKRNRTITFLDVKMKMCDLLRHTNYMPLVDQIMNEVRRVTNLPMSCPVEGNVMYNVTNVIITDDLFPVYAPPVYFNVTIDFFDRNKLLALYRLQGSILPKYK
ncbi:uncharacterized protein LOC131996954 [Stomoxys calcitrans]|uniref:uncharacterized protein LOC131996954 n=1 Tax=Stomoxys calcitrans TaxID=35570 RepID=UPI0027E315ED|nr:uncharacterized protein LOC131996954 [Stomoxys calcitrans]